MVRRARAHRAIAVAVAAAAALLVAAAVVVAIVASRPQEPPPALDLHACTIGGRSARCGTLAVPEDPGAPGGRTVRLRVAVVPPWGGAAKPDPLFWFAGWGGGGVTDDAPHVLGALREVNRDRALVFVDQRGTGASKVVCRLPTGPSLGLVSERAVTAAARRCAQRAGPGLRFQTTAVAADDVDRLRSALGYEKVNVYGASYGVTSGLVYVLRHGAHVRTAAFDSGSLLDVPIFARVAPNAQRALDDLLAACAADTACDTAYPRLRAELAQVQARLARSPVAVPGSPEPLTSAAFADALEELLATTASKAIVPRVIHLLATGQVGPAVALARPFAASSGSTLASQLLIQCNEPWAARRPAEVARLDAGTFYAPAAGVEVRTTGAACRGIPRADVPASVGRRFRSHVPVLFLSGADDPADPPANIADARREMPNSRTVVFPSSGHGQLGTLCAQNLIADVIDRGTVAGIDASCARTAVRQEFDYSG